MVSKQDYDPVAVKAARAVLVELNHVLGEYREHVVIVGGWVPSLLVSNPSEEHVASTDVDLALNFKKISKSGYRSIVKTLEQSDYYQKDDKQPFQWFKKVRLKGHEPVEVQVDFIAGEYGGRGRRRRTQHVQDVKARKARGCDLSFDDPKKIVVEGELPGGGVDSVRVRVANFVQFLTMKGMALIDRKKEKDAYDIYFVIRHYPGGGKALAKEFLPRRKEGLVMEGLQKIKLGFLSADHFGPQWVVDFSEISDDEVRDIAKQEAFRVVSVFLDVLNVEPWDNAQ